MASRKAVGVGLILILIFIVVMFGGAIFPTVTDSPIQFDVTKGIEQTEPSVGTSGRSCSVYPNDPGC